MVSAKFLGATPQQLVLTGESRPYTRERANLSASFLAATINFVKGCAGRIRSPPPDVRIPTWMNVTDSRRHDTMLTGELNWYVWHSHSDGFSTPVTGHVAHTAVDDELRERSLSKPASTES
jgi:hypothetical protein